MTVVLIISVAANVLLGFAWWLQAKMCDALAREVTLSVRVDWVSARLEAYANDHNSAHARWFANCLREELAKEGS